ncbi:MAG: IS66 family transposase [Clostridium sp.]|nr:IS66 family transposase [Clostridium sp.]
MNKRKSKKLKYRVGLDYQKEFFKIKEFVIGRKNWLFRASVKGAEASEIIYSIVETAKTNKLHPYEYLKYLIEEPSQSKQTDEKLQEDLPWSEQLPDRLKIKYEQKKNT